MSTSLSDYYNTSSVSPGEQLKMMEDAEALELLPVLLLLGLFSVFGSLGNSLSLYVYYTRFGPSSTRTYIMAMSVFDLFFTSVSLPGEMLDLRFSLTFKAGWLCGLHRFVAVFLSLVSGFILVIVALNRRRKICFPFGPQLTLRKVKCSVVGCVVLSAVIGVPFGVMNGHHTVPTDLPGVTGSACSVDDRFIHTSFPLVYNVILALVFIACTAAMIFSYVNIAHKIVQHKRKSMLGGGGTPGTVAGIAILAGKANYGVGLEPDTSHTQDTSTIEVRQIVNNVKTHAELKEKEADEGAEKCDVKKNLPKAVTLIVDDKNEFSPDIIVYSSDYGKKSSTIATTNARQQTGGESQPLKKVTIEDSKPSVDSAANVSDDGTENLEGLAGKAQQTTIRGTAAFQATTDAQRMPQIKPSSIRSQRVRQGERELEMAMKALAQAVSDDNVSFSKTFSEQLFCSTSRLRRSASEGDMLSSACSYFHTRLTDFQTTSTDFQQTPSEQKSDLHSETTGRNKTLSPPLWQDIVYAVTSSETESVMDSDVRTSGFCEGAGVCFVEEEKQQAAEAAASVNESSHLKKNNYNNNEATLADDNFVGQGRQGKRKSDDVRKSRRADRLRSMVGNVFLGSLRARQSCRAGGDDVAQSMKPSVTRRKGRRGDNGGVGGGGGGRRKIPHRTTWMMFVLTAIFIISYLPYLAIMSVRAAHEDVEVGLTGWKLNLYTLTLRSYFINSILNPVVYSFCSHRFRQQCRQLCHRKHRTFVIA